MTVVMKNYFEAVTLGAFSFKGPAKTARFLDLVSALPPAARILQFVLIAAALNFPVMLAIARLPPFELFTRLYGETTLELPPEEAALFLAEENLTESYFEESDAVRDFNLLMLENGYGRRILLPLLGMAAALVVILQAAFYLFAGFCLGLQRMVSVSLPFWDRVAFLLFLSTLPAGFSLLFGLFLPTVHLIVFYFAVILLGFYRNSIAVKVAMEHK
jgi:hypothetical protein